MSESLTPIAEYPYIMFRGGIILDYFKMEDKKISFNEIMENPKKITVNTVVANFFDRPDAQEIVNEKGETILEVNKEWLHAYYLPEELIEKNKFFIYKKARGQTYYDYVGSEIGNVFVFTDYNVTAGDDYNYLITIKREDEDKYESFSNLTENSLGINEIAYLSLKWDYFSLCDIEFDEETQRYTPIGGTWLFRANLNSSDVIQKTSVTSWNTLGKFNKTAIGQMNYDSGTITVLLGDVKTHIKKTNGFQEDSFINPWEDKGLKEVYSYTEKVNLNDPYETESTKERKWKEFVSNGNLKFLKDFKGNKWIVMLGQDTTRTVDYAAIGKVTVVSFTWEEVEDSNKYPIIKISKSGGISNET